MIPIDVPKEKLTAFSRSPSFRLIRQQRRTWRTETQAFKIQKYKPIIDEIDRALAKHHLFTQDELDFIISYDIKYRMGNDEREDEA